MGGVSHEAAHRKLHKLALIYDDNGNIVDCLTSLAFSEDISAWFQALSRKTIMVDNILGELKLFEDALRMAFSETEKPTFIRLCKIIITLIIL